MNRISHVITCCLGIIIKIKHMNMIITPFFLQHNYMQKLFNSSLLEELDTMNVIHILRMNFPKNNQVPSSFNNENDSPNHLAQETSSKISIGRPAGFYQISSRILKVCFKCLKIANFIKKCNKNFYWTSSRNALLDIQYIESYRTSTRTEDLVDYKLVL